MHVSSARTWRGGEQQVKYLLDWQGEYGMKSVLLCPANSALSQTIFHESIQVIAHPQKSSIDFSFAKRIFKIAREEQIDIVHLHDSHSHTAGVIASTFFGMKVPIILHRRVAVKAGKGLFSKFKYRHKNIKKIICVSKKVEEILKPTLIDPKITQVIHSGVDPAKWAGNKFSRSQLESKFGIPSGAFLIAHIGALESEKGFFTFLETAFELNKKYTDCYFLIVGDGSLRQNLQDFATNKGINNLIFTGFITDLTEVLPNIDILLFTSKMEGLGTTIIDAIFAKIPVVSTKVGGIPEIIDHGIHGFLPQQMTS